MNKFDAYMPYYGSDFESSTKALSREVKWSYLAALWYYWKHTKCEGIPDEDRSLMGICDCHPANWAETKPQIFGPFFKLENGLWHQSRMREIRSNTATSYAKKVERINAARAKRHTDINSDIKLDIKPDINGSNHGLISSLQSESESESDILRIPVPLGSRADKLPRAPQFKKPTMEEVIEECVRIELPVTEAELFMAHYNSNGWKVGKNPMKSWRDALKMWKHRFLKDQAGNGSKNSGAQMVLEQGEYKRIIDRMEVIRGQYSDHQTWTQKDKDEFRKLRDRRDFLKSKYGMLV